MAKKVEQMMWKDRLDKQMKDLYATSKKLGIDREAFEKLWQDQAGLNLSVDEHRIVLAGESMYEDLSHSDSLAFLVY